MSLTILYVFGAQDTTLEINPAHITGDWSVDRASANITKFQAGRLAVLGTNGYITLADGGATYKGYDGVIINNAAGNDWENLPALASGVIPVICGGCIIETDQVVETNVAIGDPLYIGTGANVGLLTKTPGTTIVGYARSANSASDKTIRCRLFGSV